MRRNQVKTNLDQGAKINRAAQWHMRVPQGTYKPGLINLGYAIEQFKALRYAITTVGAQKAWRIANEMLDNDQTPARTRWDIARTFLLMAGHVPPRPTAPEAVNDRPLVERSTADLRALVDQLEGELAGRAVPVEPSLAEQAAARWG